MSFTRSLTSWYQYGLIVVIVGIRLSNHFYFICKTITRITFKIHIFSEYFLGNRFRTNTLNQNYIESGPVAVCAYHSVMSNSLWPHGL